jgi:hypothetical protein
MAVHMQKENEMVLLLPLLKVLIVITLLFSLWLLCGSSVLFAFVSVLITAGLLVKQSRDTAV